MVEKITDHERIQEYAQLNPIFGCQGHATHSQTYNCLARHVDSTYANCNFANAYTVQEYNKSGRICAYWDGSTDTPGQTEKLVVLGNNVTLEWSRRGISREIVAGCTGRRNSEGDDLSLTDTQTTPSINTTTGGTMFSDGSYVSFIGLGDGDNRYLNMIDYNDGKMEENQPSQVGISYCQLNSHSTAQQINVTTDSSNTFIFAKGKTIDSYEMANSFWYFDPDATMFYMGDIDYFNGNVFAECETLVDGMQGVMSGKTWNNLEDVAGQWIFCQRSSVGDTYSAQMKLYNVPITRSLQKALKYVEDGTIPDDAYLYPFDPANPPRNDGTPDPEQDGSDSPDEDGDSGIDGDDMPNPTPVYTPAKMSNNNLYWLQASELERFINWFWTDAGDILDVGDLWGRIQGLYNDLASAVLNVRYFPVNVNYIGGTSAVNSIIVGNIEYQINVNKLNKVNPTLVTLGTVSISEKFKSFCDYSPFASLMLYLPFHGWIELDVDLFMTNQLRVKCLYDHIGGTIQYFIYCVDGSKQYLVNSCICKMAVDIPITLQSKNDRDSAIFNNVSSQAGNLIGAGASVASGSPIGLVMATQGISNGSTSSAPLKVMGTQGETGSFYGFNKCAYYIKRPSYNRPKNYGSQVGYPSNKQGLLGKDTKGVRVYGFTQVYNPYIKFSGATNSDGQKVYPLQREIDEIYDLLEKGVIV